MMSTYPETNSIPWPCAPSATATVTSLAEQAEAGDVRAQYQLGVVYEEGRGVPPNGQQAVAWYRRAALQNDVDAQLALGIVYAIGQGAERDYGKAFVWFSQAAVSGHGEANELRELVAKELDDAARDRAEHEARCLKLSLLQ